MKPGDFGLVNRPADVPGLSFTVLKVIDDSNLLVRSGRQTIWCKCLPVSAVDGMQFTPTGLAYFQGPVQYAGVLGQTRKVKKLVFPYGIQSPPNSDDR
jgi:hypothetical protein